MRCKPDGEEFAGRECFKCDGWTLGKRLHVYRGRGLFSILLYHPCEATG